jgi:hypothetical protein
MCNMSCSKLFRRVCVPAQMTYVDGATVGMVVQRAPPSVMYVRPQCSVVCGVDGPPLIFHRLAVERWYFSCDNGVVVIDGFCESGSGILLYTIRILASTPP